MRWSLMERGWWSGGAGPTTPFGLVLWALLGFFEAIRFSLDLHQLRAVGQPVNEGDHAGGVGEDLVPLSEGLVGRDQRRVAAPFITPGDDLEEQIGSPVVVGEVSHLVDAE